ncbi:MAG: hypothetical protein V8T22_07400 [Oscillospiraceae bacterium]
MDIMRTAKTVIFILEHIPGTYRSVFAVMVLCGTNVTLSDFGDTADAGWIMVTPRILQDNTDLQSYLPLTGGTLTGDLIVLHIKSSPNREHFLLKAQQMKTGRR